MNIALEGREQRRRAMRARWIIGIVTFASIIGVFLWAVGRFNPAQPATTAVSPANRQTQPSVGDTASYHIVPNVQRTDTAPSQVEAKHDTAAITGTTTPTADTHSGKLLIPVAGVKPEQLHDTYNEARSEGRVHNAIDIPAPQGTPILAAADGRIVKLFQSVRGGTTIYQLDNDMKTVYYYAHLQRYADGISEGQMVHQGDTIAYVGDTGDAGPGNYHLHFGISIVDDPKHYWGGTDVNPYPLLRGEKQ